MPVNSLLYSSKSHTWDPYFTSMKFGKGGGGQNSSLRPQERYRRAWNRACLHWVSIIDREARTSENCYSSQRSIVLSTRTLSSMISLRPHADLLQNFALIFRLRFLRRLHEVVIRLSRRRRGNRSEHIAQTRRVLCHNKGSKRLKGKWSRSWPGEKEFWDCGSVGYQDGGSVLG